MTERERPNQLKERVTKGFFVRCMVPVGVAVLGFAVGTGVGLKDGA